MAATSSSSKTIKALVENLRHDYPEFLFHEGSRDHWSPKSNTVTFNSKQSFKQTSYGLLHELAHALLGHTTYQSDFELLKLEASAWQLAAEIAQKYKINIDSDHIQNCLDTYRDWLHRRSTCPQCSTHVLQKDAAHYQCFNCQTSWQVSGSGFARPYRLRSSN